MGASSAGGPPLVLTVSAGPDLINGDSTDILKALRTEHGAAEIQAWAQELLGQLPDLPPAVVIAYGEVLLGARVLDEEVGTLGDGWAAILGDLIRHRRTLTEVRNQARDEWAGQRAGRIEAAVVAAEPELDALIHAAGRLRDKLLGYLRRVNALRTRTLVDLNEWLNSPDPAAEADLRLRNCRETSDSLDYLWRDLDTELKRRTRLCHQVAAHGMGAGR